MSLPRLTVTNDHIALDTLPLKGPVEPHLADLIQTYSASHYAPGPLTSFLHIWMQSHGLTGFTPVSLMLMVIAFLQVLCEFSPSFINLCLSYSQSNGVVRNLQDREAIAFMAPRDVIIDHLPNTEEPSPSGVLLVDTRFSAATTAPPFSSTKLGNFLAEWFVCVSGLVPTPVVHS